MKRDAAASINARKKKILHIWYLVSFCGIALYNLVQDAF